MRSKFIIFFILLISVLIIPLRCDIDEAFLRIKNSSSFTITVSLDTDEDGIPDTYENEHGLDPLDAADATKDKDGDGFTNLREYKFGSNPNNILSPLIFWVGPPLLAIGIAIGLLIYFMSKKKEIWIFTGRLVRPIMSS